MSNDRISELTTELAVLHFIVHQLMVAHCENQEEPVKFAQGLLAQVESAFANAPGDERWQIVMQEQTKTFFGQVVSTLKSKTSRHDA